MTGIIGLTSTQFSNDPEFKAVCSIPEFKTAFYDHDKLTADPGYHIKLYPGLEPSLCVGRTWMMKPGEYTRFYNDIAEAGGQLINTVSEYNPYTPVPKCISAASRLYAKGFMV